MKAPRPEDVHVFPAPEDFRAWLEASHDGVNELWVGFYKKGVGKAAMTYHEAVEEALCFGWIDGQANRISEEIWSNRFTPRRMGSSWSAVNIAKIADLTAAGRMHPAGMRAFEERDRRKDAIYSYERPVQDLSTDQLERLQADAAAWAYWQDETPSYRRTAVYWIQSAKRPETRERRFMTLVADSAAGHRVMPFLVERATRSQPAG